MKKIKRRISRQVKVGNVLIGGNAPVSVQGMTKTDTCDVQATVRQIRQMTRAGCDLVRLAVPDMKAAVALSAIRREISIPLVADIHFDYRLALAAMKNNADKIRLNPGNIKEQRQVEKVLAAAAGRGIPIRIGLNSGSVLRSAGNHLVEDMLRAAAEYERWFRSLDFYDYVISLKAPDVTSTLEVYRRVAGITDAPLHLGVTATGTMDEGIVKSSMGIGCLLTEGIGDTFRVSLTGDPVSEIKVGRRIVKAAGLDAAGISLISCPTCGRCKIDLVSLVRKIRPMLDRIEAEFPGRSLKVAVMGCVVNGPGEAREADVGIAWGGKLGIMFRRGEKIGTVKKDKLLTALLEEVRNEMVANAVADA